MEIRDVDQGDQVARGQVLARLQNLDLHREYEETKGDLESQRATLRLLQAGPREEEIDRMRSRLDTKKTELENASRIDEERKLLEEKIERKRAEMDNALRTYQRNEQLHKEGLISDLFLDQLATDYEVRKQELSEAQTSSRVLSETLGRKTEVLAKEVDQSESELRLLLAGAREEEITAAEAVVDKLSEKLKLLEQELKYLEIRSPIEGTVITPNLKDRAGDFLDRNAVLCEIVNSDKVKIDMAVPEKEIADVEIGFPLVMKVRGYPRDDFVAHVTEIAPVAIPDGFQNMFLVRSELENPGQILKEGMTGVGKIECGQRLIANLMTRRLRRWLRTEFWEYLP